MAIAIASCTQSAQPASATVAVAANFKSTLDALAADFESSTKYELETVIGSTGKLYAQITYGAPYDVFLAADQARPIRLVDENRAVSGSRITYAVGRLVLWSKDGVEFGPDQLTASKTKRIAIANPDLAPYGKAAKQTLEQLGLDVAVAPKLVFGENVGQAFAFIRTGNAQLGFVSEAQVLSLPSSQRGTTWIVPSTSHDPIAQDAVLLEHGADNSAAQAFMAYLHSTAARDIIAAQGYEAP